MVKEDKLSVDKTGNTHDRESEMDHSKPKAASSSDQGPFSSDPFAANYRAILDVNDPKLVAAYLEMAAVTGIRATPKHLQFLQSVEWAERMRPFKQFNMILKERGLLERYQHLSVTQDHTDERFESLQNFFHEEAPDLMGRFMGIWKLRTEAQAPISIPGDNDRESKL